MFDTQFFAGQAKANGSNEQCFFDEDYLSQKLWH